MNVKEPHAAKRCWLIDGNNVVGARPDGWWNDREGAMARLAQRVAEWCRTLDDDVTIVFDPPVGDAVLELAGGNLSIEAAVRHGRDTADDRIVELADAANDERSLIVVTSDKPLRERLPHSAEVVGAGRFREIIDRSGSDELRARPPTGT